MLQSDSADLHTPLLSSQAQNEAPNALVQLSTTPPRSHVQPSIFSATSSSNPHYEADFTFSSHTQTHSSSDDNNDFTGRPTAASVVVTSATTASGSQTKPYGTFPTNNAPVHPVVAKLMDLTQQRKGKLTACVRGDVHNSASLRKRAEES